MLRMANKLSAPKETSGAEFLGEIQGHPAVFAALRGDLLHQHLTIKKPLRA
jgi:hypothetical protein